MNQAHLAALSRRQSEEETDLSHLDWFLLPSVPTRPTVDLTTLGVRIRDTLQAKGVTVAQGNLDTLATDIVFAVRHWIDDHAVERR